MVTVLVILQSSIKSTGYDIGRVDFPLSKLLLFENKKTENIRPRKNADCTECSIVLLKNEYGAKIFEFVGGVKELHLPNASNKTKNPYIRKKPRTLEHCRTINEILITFLDKVQCNQRVTREI